MFKNQKIKNWDKSDYIRSALITAANFIVLCLFFAAVIFLNDRAQFNTYLKNNGTYLAFLLTFLAFLCILIFIYFYNEQPNFIKRGKNIFMVFAILYTGIIFSYFFGRYINIYSRPVALCALLALVLIGRREAVFLSVIHSLIIFLLDAFINTDIRHNLYLLTSPILVFVGSITAIYAVSGARSRILVTLRGLIVAAPIVLAALLFEYGAQGNLGVAVLWSIFAGVLSVVVFLITLPLFESIFNIITNYRLYELTNHDTKLIKLLKERAPGTFNHSIVVANLAEACAFAIGENGDLARAAAYYHDIGKVIHPECFAENSNGKRNPHDELTPELSTDIIRSHAREGQALIKKHRLPEFLADICVQHHGTMPIKFFYAKAKKMTEGVLEVEDFSYIGPKPQSKIAAIIMLCDACEARVRTLANRSLENVEKGVDEIFAERMEFEQFNECSITMQELEILRKNIITSLTGIYHDRVKYPRLRLKRKTE